MVQDPTGSPEEKTSPAKSIFCGTFFYYPLATLTAQKRTLADKTKNLAKSNLRCDTRLRGDVNNMRDTDGRIKRCRPIPQDEINLNEAMSEADQNDGYKQTALFISPLEQPEARIQTTKHSRLFHFKHIFIIELSINKRSVPLCGSANPWSAARLPGMEVYSHSVSHFPYRVCLPATHLRTPRRCCTNARTSA